MTKKMALFLMYKVPIILIVSEGAAAVAEDSLVPVFYGLSTTGLHFSGAFQALNKGLSLNHSHTFSYTIWWLLPCKVLPGPIGSS